MLAFFSEVIYQSDTSEPFLYKVVPIFIFVVFLIVIGTFLYRISESIRNAMATPVSIFATLIDKEQSTQTHTNTENHTSHYTIYTLVFEDKSRQRYSFDVKKRDYHQQLVGDKGTLTYKRKKFQSFERK